jgi:CRISPR-associated endonuclease/helicase Cas3
LRQAAPDEVADLEGVANPERGKGTGRRALLWRGPDDRRVIGPEEVRPGDTLVVPSEYGGADEFGWDPQSQAPVTDVGDLCVNEMANDGPDDGRKRLIRLRLYPAFLDWLRQPKEAETQGKPLGQQVEELRALLKAGEEFAPNLVELLEALAARLSSDSLTASVVNQLSRVSPRVADYTAGIVLTARTRAGFFRRPEEPAEDAIDDSTDTDDTSSLRAGIYRPVQVTLEEHTRGVTGWVQRFAEQLQLDASLRKRLERAAELHDLGKADGRFQYVLYGDEPGDVPLAKSGRDLNATQNGEVKEAAKLPDGFRHELVSVALIRGNRAALLRDLSDSDGLVEWLVGAHHGRGRPFMPFIEEPGEAESVSLEWSGRTLTASPDHGLWKLDSGWTEGFWRLVRRYGYWGLAYLEALLRLADTTRSAEEQEAGS